MTYGFIHTSFKGWKRRYQGLYLFYLIINFLENKKKGKGFILLHRQTTPEPYLMRSELSYQE